MTLTDEQQEVMTLVFRSGSRLTLAHREPIELRRLVRVARSLETEGLVRVVSAESAAYVELTEMGQAQMSPGGAPF